jgi:hypothetical protein
MLEFFFCYFLLHKRDRRTGSIFFLHIAIDYKHVLTNLSISFKISKIGFGFIRPRIKLIENHSSEDNAEDQNPVSHLLDCENQAPPYLSWISLYNNGVLTAEILASAELLQKQILETEPDTAEITESIPPSICPTVTKFR